MFNKLLLFLLICLLTPSLTVSPQTKQLPNQIPLPILPNSTFLPGKTYVLTFYTPWCQDSSNILSMMLQLQQEYRQLKIDSVLFYKVDGTKEKQLVETMDIRGFPSVRLINEEKWGSTPFEYVLDLKKDEFQYFLERELFGIIPHFDSFQHFETNKKEYQIVLSANKNLYPSVYRDFFNASLNNSLYIFNTITPLQKFYQNYYIPLEEDEVQDSCYIILLQRPNNFDKRFDCKYMKKHDETQQLDQQFKQELDNFIKEYQKPWMFFKFNHKIRQFILEHNYNCLALFSRKKTKQIEKFARVPYFQMILYLFNVRIHSQMAQEISVMTQITELIKTFQNSMKILLVKHSFSTSIQKDLWKGDQHILLVEFHIILIFVFQGVEDQEIPIVVAFYFDKEKKQIIKYKSHKTMFYYITLIPEAASALHPQNQDYNSFKRVIQQEEASKDKKGVKQQKKKTNFVWSLNYYNIERFFSLKLHDRTMPNLKSTWLVTLIISQHFYKIFYTASFCIHSKKIDFIFQSIADKQLEIFDSRAVNINFGKAELYGQDLPTKYGSVPEKVPEIRFYTDEKNYTVFNLPNKDKITEMDLVKQIIEIDPKFVKKSYLKQGKGKKDEL